MTANRKPANRPARFPGSIIVSRAEGVTHAHLYRVLLGERESPRLLTAYARYLHTQGISYPKDAVPPPAA